jgi:hypothetical protein
MPKPANWINVSDTFVALTDKLKEYKGRPKEQLAIIDYWIGCLFLIRSDIQEGKALSRANR